MRITATHTLALLAGVLAIGLSLVIDLWMAAGK